MIDPVLEKFLLMKQEEVLDAFCNINGAFFDGSGNNKFVYIPGSEKNRLLFVAHSDTVWNNIDIKLKIENDKITSATDDMVKAQNGTWIKGGIGADDRCGCAILWMLRNSGHSILITSGEEVGCVGAKWIANDQWWIEELNKHCFAVEFDRQGKKDAVFYDIGTNEFVDFIKKQTGFVPTKGGYGTDIRHMCKKICGVNFSVGYYNQHYSSEAIIQKQWYNTLLLAKHLAGEKNFPRFEIKEEDKYVYPEPKTNYTTSSYGGPYSNGYKSKDIENVNTNVFDEILKQEKLDLLVKCLICNNFLSDKEIIEDTCYTCLGATP